MRKVREMAAAYDRRTFKRDIPTLGRRTNAEYVAERLIDDVRRAK